MVNPYIDRFMEAAGDVALTFDDVTLVTRYADFLPSATSLETRLTRRVKLNIPFISAAMDTVTEAAMAIEMARLGGIGVIHRGLDSALQAKHVAKVKHYLNGLISDPIVFNENITVDDIMGVQKQKGYTFTGFPIVNDAGMLTGILTSRDMRFSRSAHAKVRDIMTTQLVTGPPGTTLQEAFDIMREHRVGKLPIVAEGKLVGLYSFTDVRTIIEGMEPFINRDENHRLRAAAAVGTMDEERIERLVDEQVDVLVVDTAHGHSRGVIETVKWIKQHYPQTDVVAGNVATGDGARDLAKAGADAIKVGVGPGSICTTRVITGVGVPQITAVYEAVRAVDDEIPVISDGGIRHSGDVPKALVAGASAVMMGSIFAGTEESPGEKIIRQGRQYVIYRGMGSLGAMATSSGSRERYAQHDVEAMHKLVPEGIEGLVPYAGSVEGVIQQFVGGLRSSLGYNGCRTIDELRRKGMFRRITLAGIREAHPHDVVITKEAPNYRTSDGH
jgi:IMP dehydrogenase